MPTLQHTGTGPRIWPVIVLGLFALLSGSVCHAQDDNYGPLPPPDTLVSQTSWSGPDNQFVTSTVEDTTGWWWGTDNDGLWHFAPNGKPGQQWLHFRAEDGLYDDSITSLCIDKKGRLWVGTERRGVSVYNNSWWHNYDIMSGPLGAHVTSIVVNPLDGSVWISSEGGIAVYSDATKTWRYITAADGLGTNSINCLAFTSKGDVIVGTSDSGLALSTAASHYAIWTHVNALPTAWASETGPGLACDQINCLLINSAGKIFCGTSCGLSTSSDNGKTWTYIHGWKWQLKVRRSVRNIIQVDNSSPVLPLSDDYISALAFDKNGYLYIGHREGGLEVINDADGSQLYHTKLDEYGIDIRSLTVLSRNGLLVGNYSDGVVELNWSGVHALPEKQPNPEHAITDFPLPAPPPNAVQVAKLAAAVSSAASANTPATAYFLGQDWQTQGNWVGRYGREFAVLCAADGSQDYVLGDQTQFSVTSQIGIPLIGTTSPSHWLQWEQSGDPRVLYDPEVNNRREAEWDDQGELVERHLEGPDIWITVQVPAGVHRLALYFMNKDGHTRTTRFRDYLIQVIPAKTGVDFHQTYDTESVMPASAQDRVENFWPGVYENFVLVGPGTYYVKIDRNYSLNTIIQGVFIDKLDSSAFLQEPSWMTGFDQAWPKQAGHVTMTPASKNAISLWSRLDTLYGNAGAAPFQRFYRLLLLRTLTAANAPESVLDTDRLELGIWNDSDYVNFAHSITRINTKPSIWVRH